ncbi:MAG: hypothetical protein JXB13_11820 [Phycisphaerae bacterium]|nr:hypothetical protein [Phycisphaerae bacterium]
MNVKVVIIVVCLLAAAAVIASKCDFGPPPKTDDEIAQENFQNSNPDEDKHARPAGRTPDTAPEFECSVEVGMENNQEIAWLTVREIHGWWVDGATIAFWHKDMFPDLPEGQRPPGRSGEHMFNLPIQFNETHTERIVMVSHNDHPGVEMGTSEDWRCLIVRWGEVVAPDTNTQ